jgi:hypothetical protein
LYLSKGSRRPLYSTKGDLVTLGGKAGIAAEKDLVSKLVNDVKSVKNVRNQMTIEESKQTLELCAGLRISRQPAQCQLRTMLMRPTAAKELRYVNYKEYFVGFFQLHDYHFFYRL